MSGRKGLEPRLTDRVTGKHQNWYLRGWEYQTLTKKNGKEGRKLVYVREYYTLRLSPRGCLWAKLGSGLLFVLMAAVYLLFETTLSQGGLAWYAGAPCLLAILPLFYLGLGVWNFLLAEKCFTYRRQRAAYFRLKLGGRMAGVLLGLGFIGQSLFLLNYGKALPELAPEWLLLFGSLFCALGAFSLSFAERWAPWELAERTEYPGEPGK